MLDKQLFLYLENFRIKQFDQLEALVRKCALCRRKNLCCTVTFTHTKSGYTMVKSLCQDCSDKVRTMHAKLKAMEDIDA